jgi:hypothetical protein
MLAPQLDEELNSARAKKLSERVRAKVQKKLAGTRATVQKRPKAVLADWAIREKSEIWYAIDLLALDGGTRLLMARRLYRLFG